jgi:hypothetical protein
VTAGAACHQQPISCEAKAPFQAADIQTMLNWRPWCFAAALAVLTIGPAASEPKPEWVLWIVKPARPGLLETCAALKMAPAPPSPTIAGQVPFRLDRDLTIHWRGGALVQTGKPISASEGWNVFDSCFVLTVGGRPVAAGAVVPRASARLLRFDTLVLRNNPHAETLEFELLPTFPAQIDQPVPQAWTHALTAVSQ